MTGENVVLVAIPVTLALVIVQLFWVSYRTSKRRKLNSVIVESLKGSKSHIVQPGQLDDGKSLSDALHQRYFDPILDQAVRDFLHDIIESLASDEAKEVAVSAIRSFANRVRIEMQAKATLPTLSEKYKLPLKAMWLNTGYQGREIICADKTIFPKEDLVWIAQLINAVYGPRKG